MLELLKTIVGRSDWPRFDRERARWSELPRNRCACYVHQVVTYDGLRAVADARWTDAADRLEHSIPPRGCPHLNSGGLELQLATALVDQGVELGRVRHYLDRAATFASSPEVREPLSRRSRFPDRRCDHHLPDPA